jgi:tartrate dehydrogenase/decarboxylase/D-malate dehydrogenase
VAAVFRGIPAIHGGGDYHHFASALLKFRRGFDQYVSLRPVRLMPRIKCPLADRKPGDIDFYVVRENTEGEYSSIGGCMFAWPDRRSARSER